MVLLLYDIFRHRNCRLWSRSESSHNEPKWAVYVRPESAVTTHKNTHEWLKARAGEAKILMQGKSKKEAEAILQKINVMLMGRNSSTYQGITS
jgi:hypothetical protein